MGYRDYNRTDRHLETPYPAESGKLMRQDKHVK
jgi:hypothetical protein